MKAVHKSFLLYAGVVAGLVLLPFITDALFGRGWVRIVDFSMLYIMLALGLNIVVGYAGLLDLCAYRFSASGSGFPVGIPRRGTSLVLDRASSVGFACRGIRCVAWRTDIAIAR